MNPENKEEDQSMLYLVKVIVISAVIGMALIMAIRCLDGNQHRLGTIVINHTSQEE